MAAQDVEFEQGSGPNQLAYGDAGALNDNLASTEPSALAPEDTPVAAASPNDYEPNYKPEGDDEQLLFGPTDRPDEPLLAGTVRDRSIPPTLASGLPLLVQAASLPGAAPQLRAIVDQALFLMNQEG